MPITKPTIETDAYLDEDTETAIPKVGTTVQKGWDAFDAIAVPSDSEFPTDFKFSEEPVLIKFLEDQPFAVASSDRSARMSLARCRGAGLRQKCGDSCRSFLDT